MAVIVTVQDLLNDFRANVYADLNDSTGLNLVNDAHRKIVKATQVRTGTRQFNLIAGTREYASSAVVERYYDVYYVRGSQDYYLLTPLEANDVDRQDSTQSEPQGYYLTTSFSSNSATPAIGFDPIPPTTTATYPYVLAYTSEAAVLALTDNLPTTLLNFDCYTFEVAKKWAERNHNKDIPLYDDRASRALRENVQFVQNLIPSDPPSIRPGYLTGLKTI